MLLDGPAVDGLSLSPCQGEICAGQDSLDILRAGELGQPCVGHIFQFPFPMIMIEGPLELLPQQMGRNVDVRGEQHRKIRARERASSVARISTRMAVWVVSCSSNSVRSRLNA